MTTHGGMAEILASRQAPGMKVGRGAGYYDACARYPRDPEGWCETQQEAVDKCKRRGLKVHVGDKEV